MPVNIGQGVLGLEARWFIAGMTMNNRTWEFPRTVFSKISNLHSLPEVEDVFVGTRGRTGETPYPVQNRGKTIVIEGRIQATTLGSLRLHANDLREAFQDRWSLVPVRSAPTAAYADGGTAAGGWLAHGKVIDFTVDDEQAYPATANPSPYQRGFTMSIRLYDPRWYLYGGEETVTDSDSVTVNNPGTAPTDPVIEVEVPDEFGIDIYLHRAGGDIGLAVNFLPGGTLVIDFFRRTVLLDGVDYSASLFAFSSSDSNWWDEHVAGLPPGVSTIEQSGGSSLSVTFTPASY